VLMSASIKRSACFVSFSDECASALVELHLVLRARVFFHDLQMAEDSASLFLLATMRTLEDKITSTRMYSCSFDSIQPVCDIANTFYWINHIYSHELRCECTPTRTEYTNTLCFWHLEQSFFLLSLIHNKHLLRIHNQHTALKSYYSISLYRYFGLLISCINMN
jgi:hypothetical protein